MLKNADHRPMVVEWSFCSQFAPGVGVMRLLKAFLADNRGATAIEYGLIAAIICGALVSGLGFFTGALQNVFNVINNGMPAN
nr:Flp family type IVb pilin [Rhizobium phaseoli]